MPSFRRNPESTFKLITAFIVVSFYLVFSTYYDPPKPVIRASKVPSQNVQFTHWAGGKSRVDTVRAGRVKEAMGHAFKAYKQSAWGFDDIDAVSGTPSNKHYGWGAFLIESTPNLALMGMWEDFSDCLEHILNPAKTRFERALDLVEPFNATSRFLGALVSLCDMSDVDMIPESALSVEQRNKLAGRAVELGKRLLVAYQSTSGVPFPRIDFKTLEGKANPSPLHAEPERVKEKEYMVEPAQVGGIFLEMASLTRATGDVTYHMHSVKAWSSLVWDKFEEPFPGLASGPIDTFTALPLGSQRHWDAGHVEYYDTLMKAAIWAPLDRLAAEYKRRWLQGAPTVRYNISSRSLPTDNYLRQHLYLGKWHGQWYLNEMSQAACGAPASLILGGTYTNSTSYIILGKAILEAYHHVHITSPTRLALESWAWSPMPLDPNATFVPASKRARNEVDMLGYWTADASVTLRPAYYASLLHAWRITGEQRYRDWAWDAFLAIERHCKTPYGFSGLEDAMRESPKQSSADGIMLLETLRFLWLIFADTDVLSLDKWLFNTAGHAFRRG